MDYRELGRVDISWLVEILLKFLDGDGDGLELRSVMEEMKRREYI